MPYNPEIQPNNNAAMGAVTQGFGNLGAGLADMQKKRDEAEAQMAGSMFGFQTLKKAGVIGPEEEHKFLSGNANQRNAIVMAATPRLLQKYQTQQEQDTQNYRMAELALRQKVADNSNYSSPYAQQPVWMTHPETGKPYQAGIYDQQGTPHFLPGIGSSGVNQFTPNEDTTKAMSDAGYTFAPTSGKAGRWINTDGSKPDLDPQGNPLFSPDGTSYISGGKIKAITQPMSDARAAYLKKQAEANQGPGLLSRIGGLFGGGAPSPTPAPTSPATAAAAPAMTPTPPTLSDAPVKVNTAAEANALPSGTVFMTPDGRLKKKQ